MSRFRHKNTYHHFVGEKGRRDGGTLVQVCKFLPPPHPPLTQSRMVIIATRPSGGFGLVGSFEDLCALRGTQKKIMEAINLFFAMRDPLQALKRDLYDFNCPSLDCGFQIIVRYSKEGWKIDQRLGPPTHNSLCTQNGVLKVGVFVIVSEK